MNKLRPGALIALVNWPESDSEVLPKELTGEIEAILENQEFRNILFWKEDRFYSLLKNLISGEETVSEIEITELEKVHLMNFNKFGLEPKKYWPNSALGPFCPYVNKWTKKKK